MFEHSTSHWPSNLTWSSKFEDDCSRYKMWWAAALAVRMELCCHFVTSVACLSSRVVCMHPAYLSFLLSSRFYEVSRESTERSRDSSRDDVLLHDGDYNLWLPARDARVLRRTVTLFAVRILVVAWWPWLQVTAQDAMSVDHDIHFVNDLKCMTYLLKAFKIILISLCKKLALALSLSLSLNFDNI